jgi:hypothetical protein
MTCPASRSSRNAPRSRAEHYLTNPAEEPDPANWEVDVAYLTSRP